MTGNLGALCAEEIRGLTNVIRMRRNCSRKDMRRVLHDFGATYVPHAVINWFSTRQTSRRRLQSMTKGTKWKRGRKKSAVERGRGAVRERAWHKHTTRNTNVGNPTRGAAVATTTT